ncbi:hypothetical protein ACF0H5_005290 [Mactra antiquata]
MKRQKRKLFFKDFLNDSKHDAKQFKTVTGSPILYTKLKKHRGIYYPLAKHHDNAKSKPRNSHKHACVVLSKTYGREVYTNIDIWPDETARERLLQKLQGLSMSEGEDDDDDDDVGIDIPTAIATTETDECTENTLNAKPPDDNKKHVTIVLTDPEGDKKSPSGNKQIHPDPNKTDQKPEGEGEWPLKRSQSVNSQDNPFLPGGNLSKEADEILSKATIIRDTFILTEENKTNKLNSQNPELSGSNHSSANQSPVQESVTQQKIVLNSECVPDQSQSPARTRPKENGQVESENSVTPGSVAVELTDDNRDKKKQKKCCVIM